jgi:replicative DNA helicase Mcm
MEKQTVSVHKASIHATLVAKTSILAAANPKYGKYNSSGYMADQINLSAPLLARFDLIYILIDEPEEYRDEKIAERILQGYSDEDIDYGVPLMSIDMLRKYIIYAKRIEPKIPMECSRRIIDFYVGIRNDEDRPIDSPLPITARQLQGLSRLSVAFARINLRDEVMLEDVEKAIRLFMSAYGRIFRNELGQLDSLKAETGKGNRDHIIERIMEEVFPVGIEINKEEAWEKAELVITRSEFLKWMKIFKRKGVLLEPHVDGMIYQRVE